LHLDRAERAKKLYERSEFIVAFAFRFHKQDQQKTAPRSELASFNRVRALAST